MQEANKNTYVKILEKGLVTLPKSFRDILSLKKGDIIKVELQNNVIILKPQAVLDIDPDQAYFWTKETQQDLIESLEDIKQGRVKRFKNADDLIDELNNV